MNSILNQLLYGTLRDVDDLLSGDNSPDLAYPSNVAAVLINLVRHVRTLEERAGIQPEPKATYGDVWVVTFESTTPRNPVVFNNEAAAAEFLQRTPGTRAVCKCRIRGV